METTPNTSTVYSIEYKNNEKRVLIAKNIPTMELAVKFALNLHEASNVEHIVHVIHDDIIDVTFVRYDGATQI